MFLEKNSNWLEWKGEILNTTENLINYKKVVCAKSNCLLILVITCLLLLVVICLSCYFFYRKIDQNKDIHFISRHQH